MIVPQSLTMSIFLRSFSILFKRFQWPNHDGYYIHFSSLPESFDFIGQVCIFSKSSSNSFSAMLVSFGAMSFDQTFWVDFSTPMMCGLFCEFHNQSRLKNPTGSWRCRFLQHILVGVRTSWQASPQSHTFLEEVSRVRIWPSRCVVSSILLLTIRYTHWWCGRWFHDHFCTPCICLYRLLCRRISACSVCWWFVFELHRWRVL